MCIKFGSKQKTDVLHLNSSNLSTSTNLLIYELCAEVQPFYDVQRYFLVGSLKHNIERLRKPIAFEIAGMASFTIHFQKTDDYSQLLMNPLNANEARTYIVLRHPTPYFIGY